ncbi:MAG: tetratricopeptide repeat protein [Bryobacteraceae bacterium]|jgi:GNAT superfamily N-acetyltransferase
MVGHSRWLAVAAGLLVVSFPALAEKKAPVRIYHPASLGEALVGKRVVVGPVSGNCSEEFASLLIRDLRNHGITVFDRAGIDAVLTEHDLRIDSLADPEAAVELGRLIGPAVMFSVEVPRCETRQRETIIEGGLPAFHKSRVEGHFIATIYAVDLGDGRELAANTIHVDPLKENQSMTSVPEYPGQGEVKDMALEQAAALAQRMYVPWTETWEVPFMDGKNCGLRQAWDLLRKGDYEGVVQRSRASAASCEHGKYTAADAWYNLGVAYMLVQNYDDALSAFDEAQKLHRNRMLTEAMAGCRRVRAFTEAMAPLWQNAAIEPRQSAEAQTDILLTNGFIIGLVRGNVAAGDIVSLIAAQPGHFSLAPDDLARLKQAAVPDAVIAAMREKK